MKVELQNAAGERKYPVIMEWAGPDHELVIAVFTGSNQGFFLRHPTNPEFLTCSLAPVTHENWRPYTGTVVLSN